MVAWSLVILTVVVVGGVVAVLARQGSPGRLSEEHSPTGGQRRKQVVDRPAGPDAEAMGVEEPGRPGVTPSRAPAGRQGRTRPRRGEDLDTSLATEEAAEPSTTAGLDAERPIEPDVEAIGSGERPTEVPDEERAVPEDVNEYVPEEPVPEDEESEA